LIDLRPLRCCSLAISSVSGCTYNSNPNNILFVASVCTQSYCLICTQPHRHTRSHFPPDFGYAKLRIEARQLSPLLQSLRDSSARHYNVKTGLIFCSDAYVFVYKVSCWKNNDADNLILVATMSPNAWPCTVISHRRLVFVVMHYSSHIFWPTYTVT